MPYNVSLLINGGARYGRPIVIELRSIVNLVKRSMSSSSENPEKKALISIITLTRRGTTFRE